MAAAAEDVIRRSACARLFQAADMQKAHRIEPRAAASGVSHKCVIFHGIRTAVFQYDFRRKCFCIRTDDSQSDCFKIEIHIVILSIHNCSA